MSQRLFVVGHPVGHSKSPVMHNAAYGALGWDWIYDFMDCPDDESAWDFLERDDWLAVNITMPWKPLALAAAAQATDAARLAQGANVLVRIPTGLWADNTDGRGCVAYLQREGVEFRGAAVAVCGTGPTSQAIAWAVLQAGAASVHLLGRDGEGARVVVDDLKARADALGVGTNLVALKGGSYDDSADAIAQASVIIDATPLGMKPHDPAPFDTALLAPAQTVFDVVYGHGTTALVAAAQKTGCATFDGAGMLVAQAVLTVHDIADVLDVSQDPRALDLFAIMAQAADFNL